VKIFAPTLHSLHGPGCCLSVW